MTLEELLKLFENTSVKKDWGDMSHMVLYSDGSGYVVDKDGDMLFDFDRIDELIEELKG